MGVFLFGSMITRSSEGLLGWIVGAAYYYWQDINGGG